MGLEPATYGLQNRCSTIELHRHIYIIYIIKDMNNCQALIFTLIYLYLQKIFILLYHWNVIL